MIRLDKKPNVYFFRYNWLAASPAFVSLKHDDDKVVVFERAGCLFVFNFHPNKSFVDYTVGVQDGGAWRIILNSDENRFGGFDRIDSSVLAHASEGGFYGRSHSVKVISV